MSGNLIVKPLSARLTRDTDFFTKMDPYVVLKLGDQTMKTQTAHGAGKTPSWKDNFTLRKLGNDDILHVEVWDKDTFTADDIVGKGYLSLANLNSKETKTVKISHKGKDAGDLMLEVEFFPDNRPASNNQPSNFNSHAYFAPYIMQNAGLPYPMPNSYPPTTGYGPPAYPPPYGYSPPPPPQQNYGQNYNAGPNYQAPPTNYGARPSGQNFGGPSPQNYGGQNYSSPPAQNNYSPQNNFPPPQSNLGGAAKNNFIPPQNNYGGPPQNNYSSPPPQGNFGGAPQNNNFGGAPQNNFPYTPPQNNNFGGSPQNNYSAPPQNNNFGVEPSKNFVSPPPQNNNVGGIPQNMNNFNFPPQNNSGGAPPNNFGAGPQGQYPPQNNENQDAARLVQSQYIGAGNEFGKYPTLGGFGK